MSRPSAIAAGKRPERGTDPDSDEDIDDPGRAGSSNRTQRQTTTHTVSTVESLTGDVGALSLERDAVFEPDVGEEEEDTRSSLMSRVFAESPASPSGPARSVRPDEVHATRDQTASATGFLSASSAAQGSTGSTIEAKSTSSGSRVTTQPTVTKEYARSCGSCGIIYTSREELSDGRHQHAKVHTCASIQQPELVELHLPSEEGSQGSSDGKDD